MQTESLRQILQQACPRIHYLEAESPEAFEGECSLWQQDDCTVIIDCAPQFSGSLNAAAAVIAQRLQWLDANRETIINAVLADSSVGSSLNGSADTPNAFRLLYTAFFIDTEQEIYCDFALLPANSRNSIELSLEADQTLLVNGWGEPL